MPIDDHAGDPNNESAEPIESDALWRGDYTPGDVCLIGPEGEFVRPDITVLVDEYSRTILSYHLGPQSSSEREI